MALFVEVARALSFRRAAEALDMPSSTLSRRIQALERAIGLRLLHRTTRRIELTEAGRIYYERCRRIVQEAHLAHEQLGGLVSQPLGVLRISLPVDFGTVFLAGFLADFSRRYPDIVFELDMTPRRVDLVSEPFDVAIRMGQLPDSHLVAHKVALVPRFLYASAEYLKTHGEPQVPEALEHHECLLLPQESAWVLTNGGDRREIPVSGRFRLNNVGMIQRLAMSGLGIAMLAHEGVQSAAATHTLRRILPEWQVPPIAVHALTETRLLPAKTQLFVQQLKAYLSERLPDTHAL